MSTLFSFQYSFYFKNKKNIFFNFILICFIGLNLYGSMSVYALQSAAVYYGVEPRWDQLTIYDAIIVSPSIIKPPVAMMGKIYVYINLSELSKSSSLIKTLPVNWFIAENEKANTVILDQTNSEWRQYVVKNLVSKLWQQGYRNFFLDGTESYRQLKGENYTLFLENAKLQKEGLINLITQIKQNYPTANLILHGGLEMLPQIHTELAAVLVEGNFHRWNSENSKYELINVIDQQRILNKLTKAKKLSSLPFIVVDYMDPQDVIAIRNWAAHLSKLGFIPWISTHELNTIGVGAVNPTSRKVLVLYNAPINEAIENTLAFHLLATPLEYLGLIPEFYSVNNPLPNKAPNEYDAVITFFTNKNIPHSSRWGAWLEKQVRSGVRLVVFQNFGWELTPLQKQFLNLHFENFLDTNKINNVFFSIKSPLLDYEAKLYPSREDFQILKAENAKILLQLRAPSIAQSDDAVALTSWGGYALFPYVITVLPNGDLRWIIDPIDFLQQALQITKRPVPDLATENGLRLLLTHVDGDGFVNKSEIEKNSSNGKVLFDKIFTRYHIPTTVSVIVGELQIASPTTFVRAKYEKLVKQIFSLPWVEIASHSYSHPYDWQNHFSGEQEKMVVKNAEFQEFGSENSLEKFPMKTTALRINKHHEILDSVSYINKYLSPASKSCKVFLWSGKANISDQELALTQQKGLANMNGGYTFFMRGKHSLTNISPAAILRGDYYQILSPLKNEEFYIQPFGLEENYQAILGAFKFTNEPRRFKPYDIHYYFNSGSRLSSLQNLEKIYEWVLQQNIFPIFISEYFNKVMGAYKTTILSEGDGWKITRNGASRELRINRSEGYPDFARSSNIIGFIPDGNNYYIHLGPEAVTYLYFTKTSPKIVYLQSANGYINRFKRTHEGFLFDLVGYIPLKFVLAQAQNCKVLRNNQEIIPQESDKTTKQYSLKEHLAREILVQCKS